MNSFKAPFISRGTIKALHLLITKSERDEKLRSQLLSDPKGTIKRELNIDLTDEHEIVIHENSKELTHLVIPPRCSTTQEEREAARTGAASLDFLKRTMYDPAPPRRSVHNNTFIFKPETKEISKQKIVDSIDLGIRFLETDIDENGAWHCIRYNISDPNIPRHYERPPFVSAYCTLALENCKHAKARTICALAKQYIVKTMEFPGLWRYYRHLPQDLDSTTTCAMLIGNHPWIAFGLNISKILSNRDAKGLFNTWILTPDEPDVVAKFRIEADPVVNANVISLLGDCPETKESQKWLEMLLKEGQLEDSSKWYPDNIAICYAIARAIKLTQPLLDHLRKPLTDQVLACHNKEGGFGNVLQTAQAITALYHADQLNMTNTWSKIEFILNSQNDDGSWPELLAFGDQKLMWGSFGQIGHASESITSAFCIEALGLVLETM